MSINFPTLGWASLRDACLQCPTFTVATMVGYFVERKDEDRLPSEKYKTLFGGDNRAFRLFKKGHFQNIELAVHARNVFFSAQCVPEMRSDSTYFLKIAVATNGKREVEKVLYAQCKRCPAGKEPFSHSGIFYAVEEFSRLGYT